MATDSSSGRTLARVASCAVGLAIALACTLLVAQGLEADRLARAVAGARLGHLGASVVLLGLAYFLRGLRWHYLFPPSVRKRGLRHTGAILLIGYLFNDFLPARAGEFARVGLMKRYNDLRPAGVLATLFTERVLDGFVLGMLALSSLSGAAPGYRAPLLAITALFCLLFLSCLCLAFFSAPLLSRIETSHSLKRARLMRRMSEWASLSINHMATLAEPRALLRAIALTLLVWLLEAWVFALVAGGFVAALDTSTIAALVSATNFAALAPTPGGLGTIEVAGTAVLELAGMAAEPAFLIVSTQHVLHYLVAIIGGGYAALRLVSTRTVPRASKTWLPASEDVSTLVDESAGT